MAREQNNMKRMAKILLIIGVIGGIWGIGGIKGTRAYEKLEPIQGLDSGYQNVGLDDPMQALSTVEILLSNVIGFLTVVSGITFAIYVVLAGLTWITAREESERISKSKQMLTNALVGLAIVAAAWALTGVMETIFGFKILHPAQVISTMIPLI